MQKGFRVLGFILLAVGLILAIRYVYLLTLDGYESRTIELNFDEPSISGIYPHLAMFNENHASEKPGETGVGAVVPWGDKLYVITYSAHRPKGSSDKLYVIDQKGHQETYPLSVGGTPANRMIHRESRQLIIGPYFIRENGDVRVISPDQMPGRLTATARHLTDPQNKVYFYTMEEGLYEVDVYSLEVKQIYQDGNVRTPPDLAGPLLPGYHGKGAYTGQDRLVVANNGEYHWQKKPESGCLAEWDGYNWKVIERKQFTEVTGPGGLYGNENEDDPVWAVGWDTKSVILKVRDRGEWSTFRLPKASFTYDGLHGWHTEWPRIRDIGQDKWLMTMHGMFWAFPPDFSRSQTSGIEPRSSYLKIIPDFARWQGMLVMGCDDASMFDNALVGQPQSNLWFMTPDQLDDFGPRIGFGGPWMNEPVKALEHSVPFLISGFDQIMIYAEMEQESKQKHTGIRIEKKEKGGNNWLNWGSLNLNSGAPVYQVFNNSDQDEWIRFTSDQDLDSLSLVMHLTPSGYPEKDDHIFRSLKPRGEADIKLGWLRPDGESGDLQIFSPKQDYANLNGDLEFIEGEVDEALVVLRDKLIPKNSPLSYDSASVIYTDDAGAQWRLPYGYTSDQDFYQELNPRAVREVATERSLLNAGSLFYELPRDISGGVSKIKPICTHKRMITDFCSWRGLMAITGCSPRAQRSAHYFESGEKEIGLWLGTIDDLWKFGKPTGEGGPWKDTPVQASEFSDPYLMYGFDQKTLELSHDLDEVVTFELYFDVTGEGRFVLFQQAPAPDQVMGDRVAQPGIVVVFPNEIKRIEFEDGFSAFWVRIRADKDCQATARFEYE